MSVKFCLIILLVAAYFKCCISLECVQYYYSKAFTNCSFIAKSQGLTESIFLDLNPDLGNCSMIVPNTKLCIRPLAASCSKYLKTESGEATCGNVISETKLLEKQLEIWNPRLNCSNALSVAKFNYICVFAYPLPCGQFHLANGNENCVSIADTYRTSLDNLISLNPFVDCSAARLPLNTGVCVQQKLSHSDYSNLDLQFINQLLERASQVLDLDEKSTLALQQLKTLFSSFVEEPNYRLQIQLIKSAETVLNNEQISEAMEATLSISSFESGDSTDTKLRDEYCLKAQELQTMLQNNTFPSYSELSTAAAAVDCVCNAKSKRRLQSCVVQFLQVLQSVADSLSPLSNTKVSNTKVGAAGAGSTESAPIPFEAEYFKGSDESRASYELVSVTITDSSSQQTMMVDSVSFKQKRFVVPVCSIGVLSSIPNMLATRAGFSISCCFLFASGALEFCLEGDMTIGGASNWDTVLRNPKMALAGAELELQAKLCLGFFNSISQVPVVGQYLKLALQFISISTCLIAATIQWFLLKGQLVFSSTVAVILARATFQWSFQAYKSAQLACDSSNSNICETNMNWCYTPPGTFWFNGMQLQVSALFYWKTIYAIQPSIPASCSAINIANNVNNASSQWVAKVSKLYGFKSNATKNAVASDSSTAAAQPTADYSSLADQKIAIKDYLTVTKSAEPTGYLIDPMRIEL